MLSINKIDAIFDLLKKINGLTKQKKPLQEYQQKWGNSLTETQQKVLLTKLENTTDIIRLLTTELEKELSQLDLPKEVLSQFFNALHSIMEHHKGGDFKKQLDDLHIVITEKIQKEEQLTQQKNQPQTEDHPILIDLPENNDNFELPPFVQIRFNDEQYEQATQEYYEETIIPELVQAPKKPIIPVEPKREYPKKQGAMLPKPQIELEQKHQDVWNKLLIQQVQDGQKQAGQKPQTDKEILSSFESLPNMKKKIAIRALKTQHPELVQQQAAEEKKAYEAQLKKNIERQKRKKEKKRLKAQKKANHQGIVQSPNLKRTLQQAQKKGTQNHPSKGLKNTLKQAQKKTSVSKNTNQTSRTH